MARTKNCSHANKTSSEVVSLKLVAQEAGVSPSTVSRYLNGTVPISEGKRAAIAKAIQKFHYVANPLASSLAGGKSRCIGVITQALDSPFYGQGLLGIEDVLIEAGYIPLFVSGHWNEADERRCISSLESRRVDGIIILTPSMSDIELLKQSDKTPMVITGRNLQSNSLRSLDFDNFSGSLMATEHLISLGHKQIAFINGSPGHSDAVQRFQGYRTALQYHGISYNPVLSARGNFLESGGKEATDLLLASGTKFTAIMAANDQMAYGAALSIYNHGLRVPDDISLVGFDDLNSSTYFIPPLTTVRHSIFEIGKVAANAMIELIEGKAPQMMVMPPQLVVRESTQPPLLKPKNKR